MDLFALRINAQLEQYITWKPEPFAMATDALQVLWRDLQGYVFPPFCLIGRTEDRRGEINSSLSGTHMAPSSLVSSSAGSACGDAHPTTEVNHSLTDPFGQPHPLIVSRSLQLAGWKVSGQESLRKAFLDRLQSSLQLGGAKEQILHISQPGQGGSAGVQGGVWIPFQVM